MLGSALEMWWKKMNGSVRVEVGRVTLIFMLAMLSALSQPCRASEETPGLTIRLQEITAPESQSAKPAPFPLSKSDVEQLLQQLPPLPTETAKPAVLPGIHVDSPHNAVELKRIDLVVPPTEARIIGTWKKEPGKQSNIK